MNKGVTGYSVSTLKAVLYVWWTEGDDYRKVIEKIILMGGDTDTTAAILGAILGAKYGATSLPQDWQATIHDWPISLNWLNKLAGSLAGEKERKPKYPFFPILLTRNLLFMVLVLFHGFKRLIPGL